jgi:hypothetical protein
MVKLYSRVMFIQSSVWFLAISLTANECLLNVEFDHRCFLLALDECSEPTIGFFKIEREIEWNGNMVECIPSNIPSLTLGRVHRSASSVFFSFCVHWSLIRFTIHHGMQHVYAHEAVWHQARLHLCVFWIQSFTFFLGHCLIV